MSDHLLIDPRLGDAVCRTITAAHGVDVDVILIVAPAGDWGRPSFVTSVDPDIMEAVIMQLGEQMQDGMGGKRIVKGPSRSRT